MSKTAKLYLLRVFIALCCVSSVASNVLRRVATLNVAGTPLPPSDIAALRKVEQGVKSLKVPQAHQVPNSTQQGGQKSGCSFFAGLTSAQLSTQCCTNVRVVSQRQLDGYGMAQQCEPDWQCGADGKTPVPSFETQALSSMCGEPGCLPAIVEAMKSSSMTESSADEMSGICSTLASLGGSNANPEKVSGLLTGAGARARGRVGKGDKKKEGEEDKKKKKKPSMCFPGEAVVLVDGRGEVPLARLRTGEMVLVERQGQLGYEPVLTFLHAIQGGSGKSMSFVTVIHTNGEFRASAAHIILVKEGLSQRSILVGQLQVGDEVFNAVNQDAVWVLKPSRVVAILRSSTQSGMYAPLTSSGTIVVDGVVASNYASSSEEKHLSHRAAHAFLFPVRVYHYFGLGSRLQPLWQRVCSSPTATGKSWLCQGGGLLQQSSELEAEELHPYLRIMWKGLRLDALLTVV